LSGVGVTGVASEKYLCVIGLSDEDTAHLRLLLRKVYGHLDNHWRWGAEENADLIILDPSELAGQIARNRAFSGGRRCAIYAESEPLRDGETRLARPLKDESLIAVLNGNAEVGAGLGAPVIQHGDDFYDMDSFNPQFELEDAAAADARAQRGGEYTPALGLDEMLKPDSAAARPQFSVPGKLRKDATVEVNPGAPSARSEQRVADSVRGFGRLAREEETHTINTAPVKRGQAPAPAKVHVLRDYLGSDPLGGPAQLVLADAPPLTLDPKTRSFHTTGKLQALAPYCTRELAPGGWKTLTTSELTQIRSEQPAQPYARLIWLDALLRSGGRLASHLDPGGRYKLKRLQQAEADFPSHARIIAALAAPAKVNEIAAASGAPMDEVFNVINAYDAIGLIEMERRLPRHAEPEPSGLFARLRKPFGK
jgi:hypothetical protein